MQKKNAAKISAIVLAMAMMSPQAVMAANYTEAPGTSTTFDKYLVMKSDAEVPNMTFHFTIRHGDAIAPTDDGTKMEVIDPEATNPATGVAYTTGKPVILGESAKDDEKTIAQASDATAANQVRAAYVTFASTDKTAAEDGALTGGKTIDFMTDDVHTDEKYAVKTLTVDFKNVKFTEPGVYRWIVEETDPDLQALTPDSVAKTLDVYVIDDAGKLAVNSYVLHTGIEAPKAGKDWGTNDDTKAEGENRAAATDVADKVSGFTNQYMTYDLTAAKVVSGNQASHDKYFKVHAQIGNEAKKTVQDADRFQVVISETAPLNNAASDYSSDAMTTANSIKVNGTAQSDDLGSYITGAQLKAGYDFYLKHGQFVTIKDLPKDAVYTYTETKEDYKEADTITTKAGDIADASKFAESVAFDDATSAPLANDTYVGFTNTRSGVIPTGINDQTQRAIVTFAAGIAAFAAILFGMKKNRKKENKA